MAVTSLNAAAQDPQLSQYYSNPIMLNPAYSGGSEVPTIFLNYRNQWPGLDAYKTSVVSADIPIDKISGGFGLLFLNENAGSLKTNNLGLSYAHTLKLTEDFSVRPGLQVNYIRKGIGGVGNEFIYSLSPVMSKAVELISFSSGLLASGKKYNAGFVIHHLTKLNESFIAGANSPLSRRYSMHGSIILKSGKFNISPHMLYWTQGSLQQLNTGFYINRGLLSTGLIYGHAPQNPDILVVSLGIRHKYFRIGYSYDISVSKLGMKLYGSHEFYLTGLIPHKRERKRLIPANLPVF